MTSATTSRTTASRLLADVAHEPLPRLDHARLVGLLREAGLTGRGGAGFPAWCKLDAVDARGGPVAVIGNGAEGEPASRKDHVLLARRPDLVLDGLHLVAGAVGARTAHLYLQ